MAQTNSCYPGQNRCPGCPIADLELRDQDSAASAVRFAVEDPANQTLLGADNIDVVLMAQKNLARFMITRIESVRAVAGALSLIASGACYQEGNAEKHFTNY